MYTLLTSFSLYSGCIIMEGTKPQSGIFECNIILLLDEEAKKIDEIPNSLDFKKKRYEQTYLIL